MLRSGKLRELLAMLFVIGLMDGPTKQARAQAVFSFHARVYSLEGRMDSVGPYASEGLPVNSGFDHEALAVDYDTGGYPFYVSNVTYTASHFPFLSDAEYVATTGGSYPSGPPPFAQPITLPSISASPTGSQRPAAANLIRTTDKFIDTTYVVTKIVQNFGLVGSLPEFAQGPNNSEVTYVRIDNPRGEMRGSGFGNDLFAFGGTTITVTFHRLPDAPPFLPLTLTLALGFKIQDTPPYPKDLATGNFGTEYGDIFIAPVPEPEAYMWLAAFASTIAALLAFELQRRPSASR